jgi:hypothetical protein
MAPARLGEMKLAARPQQTIRVLQHRFFVGRQVDNTV